MGIHLVNSHKQARNMNGCAVLLLLLVGVIAVQARVYEGYDAPDYTVLEKNDKFELRKYPTTKWVAASATGSTFAQVGSSNFMSLFAYINGANTADEKITMTVPVTTLVSDQDCAFCNKTFEMAFYMTEDPPAPTNTNLRKMDMGNMEVYVRRFGGFASGKWQIEASRLHDDLLAAGINDSSIVTSSYYAVGYDTPYRLFYRRNEIWIVKKST